MKLFPRLGPQAAKALYEELADLSVEDRRQRVDTHHVAETWAATGASKVTAVELLDLRSALTEVASNYGFPDQVLRRSDLARFDRAVTRSLFETADVELAEAAFPGMWSFLALVLLPDLTWWRAQGSSNVERFVCTDQTRHTWARLWQRGHLLTWGAEDSTAAWRVLDDSGIGEAAIDQIQTRRVAYGQQPDAFRSLLRLYGEVKDSSKFERGVDGFFSRVLRLGAFLDFRGLSEADLYSEFVELFSEMEAEERPETATDSIRLKEPTSFDELPLAQVMPVLVDAVRATGTCGDAGLVAVFERLSGLPVPATRADLIRGVAWQASSRGYLKQDAGSKAWVPGEVLPAPDSRWGGHTVASIKSYLESINDSADVDEIAASVFAGRPGKTIRRFVRGLMKEVGK